MPTLPFEPVLRRIGEAADALGLEAYAVGGAVRDALLGRATTDLDVVAVVPGGSGQTGAGIRLAEAVAEAFRVRRPAVYAAFGTAAVTLPADRVEGGGEALVVEFVGARRESYRADSRKPIVEEGTLGDDLARRDFTVNALAASLGGDRFGEIVDPFGGLNDLAAAELRTPLDPAQTFADDPLRMMRAARFAAQLGFRVVPEAREAMREAADRIGIVSQERITDELGKLLAAPLPSEGFAVLHETGLLEHVLPELTALAGVEAVGGHTHKDNLYHTLEVVDNLALAQRSAGLVGDRAEGRALWTRWAALFHDIAKPETKRFEPGRGWTFHGHEDRGARAHVPALFRRLRLPLGEPLAFVRDLVRLHHRPTALVDAEVTDSAVRRLMVEAGDRLDELMLLVRADVTSKNARRRRRYLAGFDRVEAKMADVEERDRLRAWQPPVSGDEIKRRLDLPEGVAVGILKDWLGEAVLDGDVPDEAEPAFAWVAERRDRAVHRAEAFHTAVRRLQGPERRATGAVKEAAFWDEPFPDDPEEAVGYLVGVARETLAEEADRE